MKNKYYIFLSLILLIVFINCSKRKTKNDIFNSSEDSLSSYFSMANDFSMSRIRRQEYNRKAFDIVINQENDSLHRVNLFKVANRYYNINDWKNFNKTVHLVLEKSEIAKDTLNIIKGYTYLGDYYESQAILDSSFQFYHKAEKMYKNIDDSFNLGKTLINKATLQYKAGDFLGSQQSVFNMLRVIKGEKGVDNILYDAYNLLGLTFNELGDFENAIRYHIKALEKSDSEIIPKVFQSKATTFNNIGFLYLNSKKYLLSKNYLKKGLEQPNLKLQKPYVYAMLLDNLAYAKFKLEERDGVQQLFQESLKLGDSLKLTSGIFVNKIHLSEYYASEKDVVKSLQYAQEALLLARSTKISRDILVALKQMAAIEPKKASVYTKEYIHINEELQKAERNMGEKFSRIEYETDQIKDENTNLEVQNRNLVYVFSVLIIFGLFFYIIKTQKNKNRVLLYKQQQQQANEEIYNLMISQQNTIEINRVKEKKRVAQELHDGVLGRMFGVRMNLDGLNRFDDETAINQRISYLLELKNIEQDIREISHDLSREKSELINNFVAIVDNLFEEQRKSHPSSKLVSSIDSKIKWELMKNAIKINLYRIIQESLMNINKYAKASLIKIVIKKIDGDLVLEITDDGIGFNTVSKKKGIGLENIQSRTNECNGEFKLKSKIGEGTTLTIKVPIEQKQIPA